MMLVSYLVQSSVVYGMTGAFAGLIAGTLGVGGGLVLVPILAFLFQYIHIVPSESVMQYAAGTSLAIMMLTALSSIRAHFRLSAILWPVYGRILPGLLFGVVIGAKFADLLPSYWLKVIFGSFLLIMSFKMYKDRKKIRKHNFPAAWIQNLFSIIMGFKSGLLGIGGGVLLIPYLTYCGIDLRKIPAISALCTLTVSIIGCIAFMYMGADQPSPPAYATGYVYWPAVLWVSVISIFATPLGAKWSYRLPVANLRKAFIVFMLFAALDMLI